MNKKIILNKVFNGDARNILKVIPRDIKITTTITSPPYFDMKDYDSENQIGYGQTYNSYLDDIKKVFKGVYNRTSNDGTLWVIIDTFKRNNQVVTLPFDLSNKLKEIGWLLQDIIIWKKDKTIPWSTNGFMQRKFEYILFFSKTTNFKSNKDSVRIYDTNHLKKWWVKYPERYNPRGKALDEIWEFPIPTQGSWGKKYIRHFCPLPESMVATMIQISSDENDIILDPFAGTGIVLSQSAYMKRNYLGLELNPEYVKLFTSYLAKTLEEKSKEYDSYKRDDGQNFFENNILNLRALKYARVVIAKIEKEGINSDFKVIVSVDGKSNNKNKLLKVKYNFVGQCDKTLIEGILAEIIIKPPLSKFGIDPIFSFSEEFDFKSDKLFGYSKTNTHTYIKGKKLDSKIIRVISKIRVDFNENDYI